MTSKEDLGIVIKSPEEAFWTRVKEVAEQDIKDSKNSIMLNEEIIKACKNKLKKIEGK